MDSNGHHATGQDPAHRPHSGRVLVTGGTGTLGRQVVDRLLDAGVPVRVMSRRPRPAGDERPYDWAQADLTTGTGVAAAVAEVATIVHCATDVRKEVAMTKRLLTAAQAAGGEPHLVYISIVGVDRVPFPYYRAKLASERLIEASGLPCTVLRATQFHDLIETVITVQRRLPFAVVPKGFRFQPIAAGEVAERLAALACSAPAGRVPDMGGPEVHTARDLARTTRRATGRSPRVLSLPLPGKTARAFRAGGNLTPTHPDGHQPYTAHLAATHTSTPTP